jgi:glutamine synthetase
LGALKAFINNDTYHSDKTVMRLGAKILPPLPKDATDRNRTSPLAFTGNKFEFRMVGSNDSIADCNVVLNTAVAESLDLFAKELENSSNITKTVHDIVADTVKNHERIVFNGNNYSDEWVREAEKRGLKNLKTTPEAVISYTLDKNVELFKKHKVLSETELHAIERVMLDNYSRIVKIEALTMIDMARKNIFPAINNYSKDVLGTATLKASAGINASVDLKLATTLSSLSDEVFNFTEKLENLVIKSNSISDSKDLAFFIKNEILPCMELLRASADKAETLTDDKYWPYPSYAKLLFSVK